MIKEAVEALKKVILIEERLQSLAGKTEKLAVQVEDMDRRLIAVEAKFDLLTRMAASRAGHPPESTGGRGLLPDSE